MANFIKVKAGQKITFKPKKVSFSDSGNYGEKVMFFDDNDNALSVKWDHKDKMVAAGWITVNGTWEDSGKPKIRLAKGAVFEFTAGGEGKQPIFALQGGAPAAGGGGGGGGGGTWKEPAPVALPVLLATYKTIHGVISKIFPAETPMSDVVAACATVFIAAEKRQAWDQDAVADLAKQAAEDAKAKAKAKARADVEEDPGLDVEEDDLPF